MSNALLKVELDLNLATKSSEAANRLARLQDLPGTQYFLGLAAHIRGEGNERIEKQYGFPARSWKAIFPLIEKVTDVTYSEDPFILN